MKLNKLNRKIHRYLGIIIGVQFLFWTISGLYFSWTNLDDIHGDTFKIEKKDVYFENLLGLPFSEYLSCPEIAIHKFHRYGKPSRNSLCKAHSERLHNVF